MWNRSFIDSEILGHVPMDDLNWAVQGCKFCPREWEGQSFKNSIGKQYFSLTVFSIWSPSSILNIIRKINLGRAKTDGCIKNLKFWVIRELSSIAREQLRKSAPIDGRVTVIFSSSNKGFGATFWRGVPKIQGQSHRF